jgi:hypothetical protein
MVSEVYQVVASSQNAFVVPFILSTINSPRARSGTFSLACPLGLSVGLPESLENQTEYRVPRPIATRYPNAKKSLNHHRSFFKLSEAAPPHPKNVFKN